MTSRTRVKTRDSTCQPVAGVQPSDLESWNEALDKLNRLNADLTSKVKKITKNEVAFVDKFSSKMILFSTIDK